MNFSTTSFFAGVGTVFAAVVVGFAGGTMITTAPNVEPNRVERVARAAPPPTPEGPAKTQTPEVPSMVAAKASEEPPAAPKSDKPQTPPDRVISLAPVSSSPQTVPPPPVPVPVTVKPVVARNDADAEVDNAKSARSDESRKAATAERRAERRRERRRRDLDAAENAVRQMQREDGAQLTLQRSDSQRLIFFGDN